MYEHLTTLLRAWYQRTSDRQKLQHSYLFLLVVAVALAGVITLFHGRVSSLLSDFAAVLAISFVANLLVWSVLNGIVLDKLRDTDRPARSNSRRQA